MQFIPIVERLPGVTLQGDPGEVPPEKLVSPSERLAAAVRPVPHRASSRSGSATTWGGCSSAISTRPWRPGWAGASLCVYAKQCGRAAALEHNGDLYSCDHFVDAAHRLGNIHETPIAQLANSPQQEQFGRDKEATLPAFCRRCQWLFACNGACPKDRFLRTPDGQPGLNYLCQGYRLFFDRIDPYMRAMAAEVRAGAPGRRGDAAAARRGPARPGGRLACRPHDRAQRPLPLWLGKKFKNCCLRRQGRS